VGTSCKEEEGGGGARQKVSKGKRKEGEEGRTDEKSN
jgi:hypothetical protein